MPLSHASPFDAQTPQRPPGSDRFRLIETMRWEGRAGEALARHALRMARSARHFGFPFDEEAFHAAVERATAPLGEAPHRLRLTLGPAGDLRAAAAALTAPRDEHPLRMRLAGRRALSTDPFFRHKTTWRHVYEQAYRAATEAGFDEALLLNERGEVTEGTRANLFVEDDNGLSTPPVRCGLLPGVGRAAWLAAPGAEERVLRLDDLRAGEALYLVSALRGARRAVLVD